MGSRGDKYNTDRMLESRGDKYNTNRMMGNCEPVWPSGKALGW